MALDVFVGRTAELEALTTAARDARRGSPQVRLVSGPPGVGKTTLVRALLQRLEDTPGLQVRRAGADEAERTLAYGVADQLLAGASGSPGSERQGALEVGSRLVAELSSLAEQDGLALVVEDVHWADEPSLQALGFALRRLRRDRVLTVLTCRADAVDQLSPGLLRLVADEGGQLALGGLDEDELVKLAAALGCGPLSSAAARRLGRHTEGNPLYATALLHEVGQPMLEATPGALMPAPRTYAALVRGRMDRCSAPTRDLVMAAAVLGQRSRLALVVRLAAVEAPGPHLDEAVTAGLLELDVARGEVCFPHRLVRVAVHDGLSASRRSQLHAGAAELVDDEELSLRHRVAASLGADAELAEHAAAIACRWEAAGRWAAAAEAYLGAARVAADDAAHEACVLAAVNCLLQVGDLSEAAAHAGHVHQMPPSARRHLVMGRLAMFSGATAEAEQHLRRSWDACALPDDSLVAAQVAGDLAHLAVNQGRARAAATWVHRARQSPQPPADATTVHALATGALGRVAEELADLPPVPPGDLSAAELDVLLARGVLQLWQDELSVARRDLARAEAGLTSGGPLHLRLIALFYLADAEYRMGRWGDAVLHSQLATSLAIDAEQVWTLALVHSVAVFPLAATGQWSAADHHARAAGDAARRLGSDLLWASVAAARVAHARGDPAAMHRALLPMQALGEVDGSAEPGVQPWASLMAEALVGLGRLDEAEAQLARVEVQAEARGHPTERLRAARVRGQLLLAGRRLDEAAAVLDAGAGLDPERRAPLEQGLLELTQGAVWRRLGKRRAALAALDVAHDRLVRLGAEPYLERCQAEQAACGLRPRPRDAAGDTQLTPQEQAVATLVASGATNREAAEKLVVSVKTVEYHLGHVFAKLGVTSRVQMVARLRPPEAGDEPNMAVGTDGARA